MRKILVKDFEIKSRRDSDLIAGNENRWCYEVYYIPTGKKVKDIKFYRYKDARKWISKTVKVANTIANQK